MTSNGISLPVADEDLQERLLTTVAEVLAVERSTINLETAIKDLVSDSLDQVRLFMAFEDEFGSVVSDDELDTIETFADALDRLRQRALELRNE